MAAVRLPDGRELPVMPGEKARDVAEKIGKRLAHDAVVAKLNGELIDLDAPLNGGGEFKVITRDSAEGLEVLRHSTAHAMAQAVVELYPGSKLTIGPPIENGFYYDIEVNGRITVEDLPRIEEKMREVVGRDLPIEREEISKAEAEELYKDNPYKWEIVCDLEDGDITVYRQGEFFDLCRGPHVPSTGRLGAFKLQNIAGAYWRGDESNPMLTRIYGTAWPTEKELKAHLHRLEEARARDHRKIGKDLKLFTFSPEVGAGIPLFLPKGEMLRHLMEDYVREVQTRHGYDHVWNGHLANEQLYVKSGHIEHYQDVMFPPMVDGDNSYRLKPMNCPSHMTLYNTEAHSYRDLPLRYAEFATLLTPPGSPMSLQRARRLSTVRRRTSWRGTCSDGSGNSRRYRSTSSNRPGWGASTSARTASRTRRCSCTAPSRGRRSDSWRSSSSSSGVRFPYGSRRCRRSWYRSRTGPSLTRARVRGRSRRRGLGAKGTVPPLA